MDRCSPLSILGAIGALPTGPAAILAAARRESESAGPNAGGVQGLSLAVPGLDSILHLLVKSPAEASVEDLLRQGANPFTFDHG